MNKEIKTLEEKNQKGAAIKQSVASQVPDYLQNQTWELWARLSSYLEQI